MLCYGHGRDEWVEVSGAHAKGLAGCVDERHEEYKITKRLSCYYL